jgi:hypothetical protein
MTVNAFGQIYSVETVVSLVVTVSVRLTLFVAIVRSQWTIVTVNAFLLNFADYVLLKWSMVFAVAVVPNVVNFNVFVVRDYGVTVLVYLVTYVVLLVEWQKTEKRNTITVVSFAMNSVANVAKTRTATYHAMNGGSRMSVATVADTLKGYVVAELVAMGATGYARNATMTLKVSVVGLAVAVAELALVAMIAKQPEKDVAVLAVAIAANSRLNVRAIALIVAVFYENAKKKGGNLVQTKKTSATYTAPTIIALAML